MTEPIKWRDARKVKPRHGGDVLLFDNRRAVLIGYWSYQHGSWMDGDGEMIDNLSGSPVTHWAPMPKGPRKP
jgi:hypothetical protein